jgi:hypothetical protein
VFLLLVADRLFMAWKWSVLLGGLAVSIPFRRVVANYWMGNLVGAAVQWPVAGDLARGSGVGRDTGKLKAVFASIVIERLIGAAALGVLAMASLVLLNLRLGFASQGALIAGAAVGAMTMISLPMALTSKRAGRAVLVLANKIAFRPLQNALRSLGECAGQHRMLSPSLAIFSLATFVEQLTPTASLWLISSSFNTAPVFFTSALMVMPLVSFLSRLPVTIESIGVREALYVFFLGLIGVSATEAFIFAIVARCMDLLIVGLGGGVAAWIRRSSSVAPPFSGSPGNPARPPSPTAVALPVGTAPPTAD